MVSRSHLFGSVARPDSRLLASFLAVVVAGFAFERLASRVAAGDTLAFDRGIVRALRRSGDLAIPAGPDWLRVAMIDVTALGGAPVLTLVTMLAMGFLLASRRAGTALFVGLSIGAGALLSTAIKSAFDRPRPMLVPHLVPVDSPSFPSGHAMNSAIVYLTLAVLLARSQARRALQLYLVVAAIAITCMVGASRVYLGVHWPSDVLAGWVVGALFAGAASLAAKRAQRRHAIEPPAPPETVLPAER